jgi:hypothetical protein
MLFGVVALYCPVQLLSGKQMLYGSDYLDLHVNRIRYARDALFSAHPHLPAWYTRELLGTPFWSNVQNFPFLPTHLPLLLMNPLLAYAVGVNLAAILAALFTYLYCRRIGLAKLPAAVTGWTFAASGFFASRVMVGHLPLLEAYPALPLLLWLIEKIIRDPPPNCRVDLRLLALSFAGACIAVAGHPQLPAYAIGTAFLYLLYRARNRQGFKALGAILLGIGSAGFVLWPMFRLICRSTRLLPLDAPDNNIPFPEQRLVTFFFPWKDGFPSLFDHSLPFTGYPNRSYFWDTVCYIGWLPLLSLVFLVLRPWPQHKPPTRTWLFFALLGGFALFTALPSALCLASWIPGTILRSPSRQIYLTTFALALTLGVAIDVLFRSTVVGKRAWVWALAIFALIIHVVDLSRHDLHFVQPTPVADFGLRSNTEPVRRQIGDGRVAIDRSVVSPLNRDIDDVGFFDSIMLAKPYRALLDLTGATPSLNVQAVNGSELNARALAATGTKIVTTFTRRSDLPEIGSNDTLHVYAVPSPAPRVTFIPLTQASYLSEEEIHKRLRDSQVNLQQIIMLPPSAAPRELRRMDHQSLEGFVTYERPSSDVINVKVRSNQAGFLRVLESYDPGWSATVDGVPARVLPADDFALAVRLDPGDHNVCLRYATPGVTAGAAISVLSLLLLPLVVYSRRPRLSD